MRDEDLVADWLIERIGSVLDVDPDTIGSDTPFMDLGLSSVQAVELSDDLQRWTGLTLPPTLAFDYPTIDAAAMYVAGEVARDRRSLPRPRALGRTLG
jgi:acyl carrier protein